MKLPVFLLLAVFSFVAASAQPPKKTRRLFIITIDGFRWQEVFGGADPLMLSNTAYVKDTALIRELYGDSSPEARRQKLLPFFWSVIADRGRLYGNRAFNNKVNVKNFLKISYPGYNEIFTGHTDALISPNLAIYNKNRNILEYLNGIPEYHGKVVAFTSWNVFPYILNEPRSGLSVNSGYERQAWPADDTTALFIDSVQQSIRPRTKTRYDQLTWLTAREYISRNHPSVAYIGLGETDEFAHAGRYDLYLQHAAAIDRMIAELWYVVQTDPFYRDSTTFLITTDHGRGGEPSNWSTHGFWAKGSGQTWLAVLGPDIPAEGEIRTAGQVYAKQFAATMALLLGASSGDDRFRGRPIAFPAANKEIGSNIAGK